MGHIGEEFRRTSDPMNNIPVVVIRLRDEGPALRRCSHVSIVRRDAITSVPLSRRYRSALPRYGRRARRSLLRSSCCPQALVIVHRDQGVFALSPSVIAGDDSKPVHDKRSRQDLRFFRNIEIMPDTTLITPRASDRKDYAQQGEELRSLCARRESKAAASSPET